jgi:CRP-like cAMP-binding protein
VRKLEAHLAITDADRADGLALPHHVRRLEAQSYTMREGDRPDKCAVLLSGFAFRHKVTGEGARQIMALHIPGDALDFQNLFLKESDHTVQMLTRGIVAEIPMIALEQLTLSNSDVGRAILITTLIEASTFRMDAQHRAARRSQPHRAPPVRIRLPPDRLRNEAERHL